MTKLFCITIMSIEYCYNTMKEVDDQIQAFILDSFDIMYKAENVIDFKVDLVTEKKCIDAYITKNVKKYRNTKYETGYYPETKKIAMIDCSNFSEETVNIILNTIYDELVDIIDSHNFCLNGISCDD